MSLLWDLLVELRRVPVAPVGELRYTMHVDPTPYYDHLDGKDER